MTNDLDAASPHSNAPAPRPTTASSADAENANPKRSRRLLLLERTMYRDGFTPFTSVFSVKLRGDLGELQLRRALIRLQAKHPLLRCVVEEAADGPRFVLQSRPEPIPLTILERNTDQDWECEVLREWLRPFGSAPNPLIRLRWLRGRGLHELILMVHHCICDGPSGITLLRDCLAGFDDPESEPDRCESLGAVDGVLARAWDREPSFQLRVRRRSALLRLALLLKLRRRSALCLAPSAATMYFHRWRLDPAESRALIESCRKENVSVLPAVATAVVQAFREIRGTAGLKHAYAMVNIRKFLPSAPPDTLVGVAPGVPIGIKSLEHPSELSAASFWKSARAIRQDLTARISRLGQHFDEYLAALETLHDRYPRLIAHTEASRQVRHVTFSNLGPLDLPRRYRTLSVEQCYSPLVMVSPSPANTLVISTFAGAMEFALISDTVSLPETQAHSIEERAMAILRSHIAASVSGGASEELGCFSQRAVTA